MYIIMKMCKHYWLYSFFR